MSTLVTDDHLLDDMAAALSSLVLWLTEVGFEQPGIDIDPLHELLRRHRAEVGR